MGLKNMKKNSLLLRAFVGIDPGVSTGVAVAVFNEADLRVRDFADCMKAGEVNTATLNATTVQGEVGIGTGVRTIITECMEHSGGEVASVTVAVEDFILRSVVSWNREVLSPVRITACIHALCLYAPGVQWERYSPAEAKGIVTNERLRAWGGWVRGRDHERDAVRQLIMAVRKYRSGHGAE